MHRAWTGIRTENLAVSVGRSSLVQLPQAGIALPVREQGFVASALYDAAAVEDYDLVNVADGEEIMRDDDRRTGCHQPAQWLEHAVGRLGVKTSGGLVQDENRRVADHRSRDRESLALAT